MRKIRYITKNIIKKIEKKLENNKVIIILKIETLF